MHSRLGRRPRGLEGLQDVGLLLLDGLGEASRLPGLAADVPGLAAEGGQRRGPAQLQLADQPLERRGEAVDDQKRDREELRVDRRLTAVGDQEQGGAGADLDGNDRHVDGHGDAELLVHRRDPDLGDITPEVGLAENQAMQRGVGADGDFDPFDRALGLPRDLDRESAEAGTRRDEQQAPFEELPDEAKRRQEHLIAARRGLEECGQLGDRPGKARDLAVLVGESRRYGRRRCFGTGARPIGAERGRARSDRDRVLLDEAGESVGNLGPVEGAERLPVAELQEDALLDRQPGAPLELLDDLCGHRVDHRDAERAVAELDRNRLEVPGLLLVPDLDDLGVDGGEHRVLHRSDVALLAEVVEEDALVYVSQLHEVRADPAAQLLLALHGSIHLTEADDPILDEEGAELGGHPGTQVRIRGLAWWRFVRVFYQRKWGGVKEAQGSQRVRKGRGNRWPKQLLCRPFSTRGTQDPAAPRPFLGATRPYAHARCRSNAVSGSPVAARISTNKQ